MLANMDQIANTQKFGMKTNTVIIIKIMFFENNK